MTAALTVAAAGLVGVGAAGLLWVTFRAAALAQLDGDAHQLDPPPWGATSAKRSEDRAGAGRARPDRPGGVLNG